MYLQWQVWVVFHIVELIQQAKQRLLLCLKAGLRSLKISILVCLYYVPAFVKTRIYASERNRPEIYKSDTYDVENESSFSKQTKQMVKNGIDASIVGNRVVEAISDGELYIFTHPNYRAVNQARFAGIDEAFAKSEKSSILKDIVNQKIDML